MPIGKQLSDGNPDGTALGQSITDKIGFYGLATPIVQPAHTNQATVATTAITAAATTTTPFGFATSTQADNLTAIVHNTRRLANQTRDDLVAVGLIKGSI